MKKRAVLLLGLITGIGFVATLSGGTWTVLASSGNSGEGKLVYEKHCLGCHGPRADGDSPMGKALVPPAADLTSAATKKKSDAGLANIIKNGKEKTAMPPFKTALGEQEVLDVVAYLRSLSR